LVLSIVKSKPRFPTWLRRVLVGIGLLFLAVSFLASSIFALSHAAPSKLGGIIESVADHFLGGGFRIGELVELELGSDTYLVASNVKLLNPNWVKDSELLQVERLLIRINIPSIWRDGPILIDRLEVTNAKISLFAPEDSAPNWQLFGNEDTTKTDPKSEQIPDDPQRIFPVLINHGLVRNGQITYLDPDQRILVDIESMDIHDPGSDSLITIDLNGSINEIPIEANGHIGPASALLAQATLKLDLKVNWGQLIVEALGSIENVTELTGQNMHVKVSSPKSRPLLDALGMQEVRDGPLFFEGSIIDGNPGVILNLDGTLDEFDLRLSGRLGNPKEFDDVDLHLALGGPSVAEIGAMFEIHGLPAMPYQLSGDIRRKGTILSIDSAKLTAGEGNVSVQGSLPNFPEIDDWKILLSGSGVNLSLLEPLLGIDKLPSLPYEFQGELKSNDDDVELISFHFSNPISNLFMNGIVGQSPTYLG
jgi:hypothetical protein